MTGRSLAFLAAALVGVGLLVFVARRELGGDDASVREDIEPYGGNAVYQGIDTYPELGDLIAEADGWTYWYGRGAPSTPWMDGAAGVDCNGFVQMALVRLGILSAAAPDRSARAMADACDPVPLGEQRAGDLAYYPGHTMLVAGPPGADGHSPVIGASGGRSTTKGDNPSARVKLFPTGAYRGDFATYMRLKPENQL